MKGNEKRESLLSSKIKRWYISLNLFFVVDRMALFWLVGCRVYVICYVCKYYASFFS